MLDVENPPGVAWWGEGDEKITVDGEAFPSLFGTGTEDYFGYAWSTARDASRTPTTRRPWPPAGGFGGLYSMNRFHILDPIPFARSLRFDLEIGTGRRRRSPWTRPSTGTRGPGAATTSRGRSDRLLGDRIRHRIGGSARSQVGPEAHADEGQRRATEREPPDALPNSTQPSASDATGVS